MGKKFYFKVPKDKKKRKAVAEVITTVIKQHALNKEPLKSSSMKIDSSI